MSNDFANHCADLLRSLGPVRTRRMFGGHGLYVDDLFVAIIDTDRMFLKADDATRARFEAAGCEPFRYDKNGEFVSMSYFEPPAEAIESPALMQPWARLAFEAALRAANDKAAVAAAKAARAAARAKKRPAQAVAAAKAAAKPALKRRPATKP